jgi:hypothetical protein
MVLGCKSSQLRPLSFEQFNSGRGSTGQLTVMPASFSIIIGKPFLSPNMQNCVSDQMHRAERAR